jgi:hypothetical protein
MDLVEEVFDLHIQVVLASCGLALWLLKLGNFWQQFTFGFHLPNKISVLLGPLHININFLASPAWIFRSASR